MKSDSEYWGFALQHMNLVEEGGWDTIQLIILIIPDDADAASKH